MAGVIRLGFRRIASRPGRQKSDDWRWSLAAADPAANLVCGAFPTSDGQVAPYRLWRAEQPKALILLLHGAFDYSGAFDEIGPKLAEQGFTALAFDQRGFGATRSRRHWCGVKRMTLDVADALAFLRSRFGALPVFVVGESMGADIALQSVARGTAPDVAGLVLAAPGAVAGLLRRFVIGLALRLWHFIAPKGEIDVVRVSGREFTHAGAIRLLGDPMVLRSVRPAMASGLLELAVATVSTARGVTVPALTLVGSKEDFLSTRCIERLHRNLAGEKTWHLFEGGPHLLFHWRRADEVLDEALNWIAARLEKPFSR
jgi:alpha-beta hydrolase superfamily lysophospholipase